MEMKSRRVGEKENETWIFFCICLHAIGRKLPLGSSGRPPASQPTNWACRFKSYFVERKMTASEKRPFSYFFLLTALANYNMYLPTYVTYKSFSSPSVVPQLSLSLAQTGIPFQPSSGTNTSARAVWSRD